jgi:hypothetical protein
MPWIRLPTPRTAYVHLPSSYSQIFSPLSFRRHETKIILSSMHCHLSRCDSELSYLGRHPWQAYRTAFRLLPCSTTPVPLISTQIPLTSGGSVQKDTSRGLRWDHEPQHPNRDVDSADIGTESIHHAVKKYLAVLTWRRGRRAEAINGPKIQKLSEISLPQVRCLSWSFGVGGREQNSTYVPAGGVLMI